MKKIEKLKDIIDILQEAVDSIAFERDGERFWVRDLDIDLWKCLPLAYKELTFNQSQKQPEGLTDRFKGVDNGVDTEKQEEWKDITVRQLIEDRKKVRKFLQNNPDFLNNLKNENTATSKLIVPPSLYNSLSKKDKTKYVESILLPYRFEEESIKEEIFEEEEVDIGMQSGSMHSGRRILDMLTEFVLKELDKAREEGRREYARELLDDYYQPDSDSITVDVSEIQSELSKLKDNK